MDSIQLTQAGYALISSSGVNPCEGGQTPCNSGQCIPSEDICNGQDDCGDGSDEEGCCTYVALNMPETPFSVSVVNSMTTVWGSNSVSGSAPVAMGTAIIWL